LATAEQFLNGGTARQAAARTLELAKEVSRPEGAPAPKLSIIVVTWNVRDLTLRCLHTLWSRAGRLSFEVIVVDNASNDATADAVRLAFPDATVIANEENVGFPRANNQALRVATGEYVLFLNPDTVVGEGTLEACVAALDEDPSVGMVGCRLQYENGEVQLECARRPYGLQHLLMETLYLHMFFPRHPVFGHHLMGDWDHTGTRDVEAICGAFMMVRRDTALRLGGLPEDLFMYHEDLSFCLRLRRAGWRIRYLGDHTTMHYWQRSTRRSYAPIELLEGEHKLLLIREAQGPAAAAVGRGVFAVRSVLRLAIAGAGSMLPDSSPLRNRYPRVFDARRHALQLAWSVAPNAMRKFVGGIAAPAENGAKRA
jgi:hypothetical protein